MPDEQGPLRLAERVADTARELGIDTVLIGAYALAAHDYVRATADLDLASAVQPSELQALATKLAELGLHVAVYSPDEQDDLGGKVVVWEEADEDGDPVEPVEVVNFLNIHRPRRNPAVEAIRHASPLAGLPSLRYPKLEHLIALKLDAGAPKDELDVIELLQRNRDADVEVIRATCKTYGLERIDALIDVVKRRLDA
ncbi:MAG: hypothetical protein SFX73_34535 [Kofleriaceae bacterium]|nr:hypothetical protein [Kofleriaceae bacterium]